MVDTLKKASLSFAAARTINALVSVAQKIETGGSVKLLGTGGSAVIAPFEWLDPLNDLVERFSLVMLTSCVAMGILLFLNQIMPWLSLAVLLPASVLLLLFSLGIKKRNLSNGQWLFRTGYKLLAITAVTAIMIPAMTAINALTYSYFLENTYETATITIIDAQKSLATIQKADGLINRIENLHQQAATVKVKAERVISHVLDLIIVFIIQTILLPLFMLWLFIKLISRIADSRSPLQAESFLA